MLHPKVRLFLISAAGVAAVTALGGCDAAGTAAGSSAAPVAAKGAEAVATLEDPLLANPRVGDLWAAKLSAFSGADFRQPGQENSEAFGLMKVVGVTDDRVTVITETSAWPNSRGAQNDLRGTMADITWDPSEEIPINRSELAAMVEDDRILETRRMEGATQ